MSGSTGRPELVAKVVGGLGNQLFVYAAARRLASASDAQLVLDVNFFRSDTLYGRQYRLDRFRLAPHSVRRGSAWLPPALDRRAWRLSRAAARLGLLPGWDGIIERTPNVFEPSVLLARLGRRTLFDGYWQDERYFEDLRGALIEELRPAFDVGARNLAFADQLRQGDWIGVHCRRRHAERADGTPVRVQGRTALPDAYYTRALEALRARGPLTGLALFGDHPHWLLEHLPPSVEAVVVDWNAGPGGEASDLWLMSLCRRLVISNSTLSWWGGWLGAAAGREVMAPRPQDLAYWVRSAAGWEEIQW